MSEKVLNGQTYKIGRLPAMVQFKVAKRLMPLLGSVLAQAQGGGTGAEMMARIAMPLMSGVAAMPDEDCDFILSTCLGVVERNQGTNWATVWPRGGAMMFSDMDLSVMLQLVWAVLQENLGGFLPAPGSDLIAPGQV